jgi:hypothetical protein
LPRWRSLQALALVRDDLRRGEAPLRRRAGCRMRSTACERWRSSAGRPGPSSASVPLCHCPGVPCLVEAPGPGGTPPRWGSLLRRGWRWRGGEGPGLGVDDENVAAGAGDGCAVGKGFSVDDAAGQVQDDEGLARVVGGGVESVDDAALRGRLPLRPFDRLPSAGSGQTGQVSLMAQARPVRR